MTMQEALDVLKRECYNEGGRDVSGADGDGLLDVCISAAEAAVLALFTQQKAVADGLAEALDNELIDPCRLCDYEGRHLECEAHPHCANDMRETALAAYNKAKEGKHGL